MSANGHWTRLWRRRLEWLARMVVEGHFRVLAIDFGLRVYRGAYYIIFHVLRPFRKERHQSGGALQVKTKHPIAFESPDHAVPWGTMNDNSSNKKFVLHMQSWIARHCATGPRSFMDLGCSGGQLVKDFKDLGWQAVGLEGSDYSLRNRRANWKQLAGKNLFTADITKPFEVLESDRPLHLDLITAWEVLEHIRPDELDHVFGNIIRHLKYGGVFVASTTSAPDVHDGIDLHQCKMTNSEWRQFIAKRFDELEPVELGLKPYEYVRFNPGEPSFLSYRRKNGGTTCSNETVRSTTDGGKV